jgi:histidine triad (HIT) family protein
LHVHIVPRRRKDGLRGFFWPRGKYETEHDAVAARDAIRAAVAEIR